MSELIPALATTAFQVIWGERGTWDRDDAVATGVQATPLGGCHALRLDGPVVQRHFLHLVPQGAPPSPSDPETRL